MGPERCGTISRYFQKKYRVDGSKQLYQVLAYQEAADNKLWASTNELVDIRSVSLVHWHRDWGFHGLIPHSFEIASPTWELSKAASIVQGHVNFLIVSQCQFCDYDPHKQVYARQAEVTEVILLHVPPTICKGKRHILDTGDRFTHCASTIIVVFRRGISLGSRHRAQSSHLPR